jgi:hypothetical protein
MMLNLRAAASVLLIAMSAGGTASAQKPGGVCWQPYVKGLTIMVTSIFNGNRREDV